MTQPMYPNKNPEDYATDFAEHMQAMTAEGLHSKSDIAVQLSWRDAELRRLHAELELQRALVAEAQTMTTKVCAENEALRADAELLDWMESDGGTKLFSLGRAWYTRKGPGWPIRKQKNLRAAIVAARKEGK